MAATMKKKESNPMILVNVFSVEGLRPQASIFLRRPLHIYAVVWLKPSDKARTNHFEGASPKWDEKFTFSLDDTSDFSKAFVNVGIYATGVIKDRLIGAARFPLGKSGEVPLSAFTIQSHSGRSRGVVNVAVKVIRNGLDSPATSVNRSGMSKGVPNVAVKEIGEGSGSPDTFVDRSKSFIPVMGKRLNAVTRAAPSGNHALHRRMSSF